MLDRRHQELPAQVQLVWSLLGEEEATEVHVILNPVEREVHGNSIYAPITTTSTLHGNRCAITHACRYIHAYLKWSSKGEWVLFLWAHQPAPCTNHQRNISTPVVETLSANFPEEQRSSATKHSVSLNICYTHTIEIYAWLQQQLTIT